MRPSLEWLLRGVAIVLLVVSLVHAIRSESGDGAEQGASADLPESLARWTTVVSPDEVHVALDHPPTRQERDWLAALDAARTEVEWSGPSLLPTAIAIEPRADPARGADVSVAVPPGTHVALRDTVGLLDSVTTKTGELRAYIPQPRPAIDAVVGPVVARAARHDSLVLGRLLVIGKAGWETKFVVAALEERGWQVDAHIVVSPKSDVRQGRIAGIDTARYSAVLALDTTAARYGAQIARYVRSGGGLVLWTPAARTRALAPLAPGGAGLVIEDEGKPPSDSAPREALEVVPITPLVPDAIALEYRDDEPTLAARRVGPGRVIQTGYMNSWRWRMAGGDDAPDRHRDWIAGLVSRVAYTGRVALGVAPPDPAPLATLISVLGDPTPATVRASTADPDLLAAWVFAILCAALLLEWASRRTRGVK